VCAGVCAQVVGVDALHTKDVRHTHRLLVKHLLALRSIPIFAPCKLVFVFECAADHLSVLKRTPFMCACALRRSNLAFESQHLLHAVEAAGIKNWVSLSEGQQGTLGWLTVRC
tara:strand:+ start:487 stop:825 length:339 start_codon:yes stop_codon:yes gene_type:complete